MTFTSYPGIVMALWNEEVHNFHLVLAGGLGF